ncbi:CRISPR-associated ring nuclease Csm6 [Paraferrimonas haliotis]|uniref:CRISPR-associated ring nuclease Csm6 n=1 Tax=Paraferrimonas haliotis TaxID=2013866 RepID=UPI000BA94D03|nr:CRISPR-associated ring nuclease Csm6 [Paraferrimonas haliotis]
MKATTLITVLGSSPAVITETLYALKNEKSFPDKLVIFTTTHGRDTFFQKDVPGIIKQLCIDYALPQTLLDDIQVSVAQAAGVELDDIRSHQDQEAMANAITQTVRALCDDHNRAIHASIAGGRKSMSFYMGYIFSMFARPYDRLSHVLVSPEYEAPNLYYPTPYSNPLQNYDGSPKLKDGVQLDGKDAQVDLSTIPFIRLNSSLEPITLEPDMSYTDCIKAYQLSQSPSQISLVLDEVNQVISINDKTVELSLGAYAYYAFFIQQTKQQRFGYKILNKTLNGLDIHWLEYLAKLRNITIADDEDIRDDRNIEMILEDFDTRTLESVKQFGINQNLHSRFKKEIDTAIAKSQVDKTIDLCGITMVDAKPTGEDSDASYRAPTKGGFVGLCLNPNQIHIIEN